MPPELGRALCIITGASRGFGRTIAKELNRVVKRGSAFVLVARSGDDLRSLKAELTDTEVRCVEADLGLAEGLERVTNAALEAHTDLIEHVLLVNNAGSLGDISRFTKSFTDMAEVSSYLSLNVSSFLCLTAQILQAFPPRPGLRRTVINISSLCALQPFSSWVLYCSGKAARDMMFRVLAEEEPELRVLSYAPGPLDTDMQLEARSKSGDMKLRKCFSDMFSQGRLLSCDESCAKLMKLLIDDSYTSGAHIDFYDI